MAIGRMPRKRLQTGGWTITIRDNNGFAKVEGVGVDG